MGGKNVGSGSNKPRRETNLKINLETDLFYDTSYLLSDSLSLSHADEHSHTRTHAHTHSLYLTLTTIHKHTPIHTIWPSQAIFSVGKKFL